MFYIFSLFLFLCFCLFIWGFLIEPNAIKIENVSFEIKDLPSNFEDIKIVQLSDLHSRSFGKREEKVLEILSKIQPDFIFITGDIVDWTTKDIDSCQIFWQELSRNYQGRIFGVYGNHEHKNPRFNKVKAQIEESGIHILNNEARDIHIGEDTLCLIGVDDPHLGFDDINQAMAQTGKSCALKILLAHSPEVFRNVKEMDIDLVLVGHTHGGQINIPFVVDFFLPLNYDKKYKEGMFYEDPTYLYVNRGIGTTFLPLRFNAPPEITLIRFIDK